MKGVFLVIDGAADEPCTALGHSTPLQVAKTPNLDALAANSRIEHCFPLKKGMVAEGANTTLSLLGYDSKYVSQGVLEALGSKVKFMRGDLAMRTNFATVSDLDSREVMDRRAGRTVLTKEARILASAINSIRLPFQFEFYPTMHHKGVVVFRGGFSDNITNVDPCRNGDGISNAKFDFSTALDDDEESKVAAEVVNNFVRKSHEVLDVHNLNKRRAQKGLYSANFILCRDAGTENVNLKKLKGKWAAAVYNPLEKGVARAAKMDVYGFAYPKLKSIDVYANAHAGLKKAIKNAIKVLKKKGKYDYFFIHIKEPNLAGQDNKPHEKVKMIELLDKRLFSYLKNYVMKNNGKLVIASSITSCRKKDNLNGAVPILYYSGKDKEEPKRFTEEQAIKGRKVSGKNLLERTLFAKD